MVKCSPFQPRGCVSRIGHQPWCTFLAAVAPFVITSRSWTLPFCPQFAFVGESSPFLWVKRFPPFFLEESFLHQRHQYFSSTQRPLGVKMCSLGLRLLVLIGFRLPAPHSLWLCLTVVGSSFCWLLRADKMLAHYPSDNTPTTHSCWVKTAYFFLMKNGWDA